MRDAAAGWVERGQRAPGPTFKRALASWLAANPTHQIAYDEALSDWRASANLGDTPTGRERRLVRAPFLMRRNTHFAAAGIAAAALVFVVLGSTHLLSPFAAVSEARAQILETARGEIRDRHAGRWQQGDARHLKRWCGFRSRPASADALLSRGRARFAVAPDAERPFVVLANGRAVTGTQATFDVSLDDAGPFVTAVAGQSRGFCRHRRQRAPARQSSPVSTSDPAPALDIGAADRQAGQWVSGMLVVDATPLGDAVAVMNRYNRIAVRISDPNSSRSACPARSAFRIRQGSFVPSRRCIVCVSTPVPTAR